MDDSPKKNSKLSIRPQTHDISRIEYHIEDLKTFGDDLTEAAVAAFPNKGKTRYAAVHVLLLSWENDTLGVITELLELQEVLQTNYSFHTEEWKIPSNRSHNSLAHRIMQFLAEFESQENLLIIYYGGHGNMNDDRQCVWSCSSELDSSEVQWYGLQTMLEQARSDVLILLDCCAAASSAAGSGTGVTEVIAACGFESTAPGVGEHSFTRSLIEELKHLSYGPSFSAALLHNKVLSRMKYFKPRFATGGNREQRRTPVYILLANERKRRSIELTPMVSQNPLTINKGLQFGSSTQVSTPSSGPSNDVDMQSSESSKSSVDEIWHDVDPDCPKVLISIALEKDQLLGQDEWTEWLKSVPALVNNVTVEGVFKSDSTLYLLSLPVAVWDMLPENRAISFIGFVRSTNMVPTLKKPTRARNLAQANSTFMPMTGLAISHSDVERRKEGMELEEEVLKARQSTLGSETPDDPLAMEMREKVLKASQRTLADGHPDILLAFHNLAINYSDLGRTQEAIELGEKVLEASQRMLGSEHPNTLKAMAGLANSYSNLGRRQEAIELREKVLEAILRTGVSDHPDTLKAMNNLATSYSNLGRRQEAMELREKVLEASHRTLGSKHPENLSAMNNLALSYSDLGRRQEAMKLQEKVLEASQRTLGSKHPDNLSAMNNLAISYSYLGRSQEAMELIEKVLKARQRTLGSEHPDTLIAMNNLALSYSDLGRRQEAMDMIEKVLEARQRTLGSEHPDTLKAMNNLANSYGDLGRRQEARELIERALEASRRTLGSEHPDTLRAMSDLAYITGKKVEKTKNPQESSASNTHPQSLVKSEGREKVKRWFRKISNM